MTDADDTETIRLIINTLKKLDDRTFEMATGQAGIVARISSMPTKEDMFEAIGKHGAKCERRRRWAIGIMMAIPAAAAAALAVLAVLP